LSAKAHPHYVYRLILQSAPETQTAV